MKKMLVVAAMGAVMMVSGQAFAADNALGKKTYETVCFACHGTGAAGAPKFEDKAAWGPRIKKGLPTLENHALHGFTGTSGTMPAKGGRTDLPDADVKAAVQYMVSHGK